MQRRTPGRRLLLLLAASLAPALASAEVIHLHNGDVIHGVLVAANNTEVTLETPYGTLVIPKKDIERIDYQEPGGGESSAPSDLPPAEAEAPTPSPRSGDRASVTLQITGRSFWYAFESPPENPADTSIRLQLHFGDTRACTFADRKPDTVDGPTLYNSFTFSPTDSEVVATAEGYECRVEKAEDGTVVLRIVLARDVAPGEQVLRMLYEINEGSSSSPRWVEVVSRAFAFDVAPGRETRVLLEQNADALEYSGFFKKRMKNVDLFQIELLAAELQG